MSSLTLTPRFAPAWLRRLTRTLPQRHPAGQTRARDATRAARDMAWNPPDHWLK
ncbi:hypothetical protein [Pseudoponticoccus marisrubri]|uniref:hypothetical protein n=1 Tax=Pseudoponticoccus marisrubri TaxID=1685382 RepID=UPI0012FE1CCC|nr:hypothetical protein [Pseudoponticoccus marisrubri]